MIRQVIKIDEDKCVGCGLCANACQEGAIAMVDGKAKLVRDDYCDGLGNCLPVCPVNAIRFEQREAAAFDKEAAEARKAAADSGRDRPGSGHNGHAGCPGSRAMSFRRPAEAAEAPAPSAGAAPAVASQLRQWPVQIKLVPVNAPYFDNANLLIAADCTAFTYGDFHRDFIRNHVVIVGCPKLDEGDYSEKLTEILKHNNIKSVKVVRMEVPCCGGIERATVEALKNCGKMIPWQIVTISTDGTVLER